MSQQEFMPKPQSSRASQEWYEGQSRGRRSLSGAEINVQPYSQSRGSRTSDMPKSDHPSTFEDSLPPYSYPAQDQTMLTQPPNPEQNTQRQQAQPYGISTGRSTFRGAYQFYSQYNAQQQVPWWTQRQEDTINTSRWIGIFLLIVALLVSIPMLCSIGTVFVSMVFLFTLLPVILSFAPITLFLLIPLLKLLHTENRNDRWRNRHKYGQSWWWW